MLQRGFERGPLGAGVVFRQVDADLVTRLGLEVRNAGQQHAVLLAVDVHKVMAVLQLERAHNLLARNRADLLVHERAVVGDGQFKNVALNELGFAGVVGWHWISLAVGADHVLTVKNALDYLAEVVIFDDGRYMLVIANQADEQLVGGG